MAILQNPHLIRRCFRTYLHQLKLMTDSKTLMRGAYFFFMWTPKLIVACRFSSAPSILSAVQKTLAIYETNSVVMVGHSLGAALAVLDSVFLPLYLPSSTSFKTFTYGLPRVSCVHKQKFLTYTKSHYQVGNQDFANYVDANTTLTHINNMEDPVPILPGMFLGYHHPAGELHIQDSGVWTECPGQDNPSTMCIVGDVPTIFQSNESDHDGPYNGIEMGGTC